MLDDDPHAFLPDSSVGKPVHPPNQECAAGPKDTRNLDRFNYQQGDFFKRKEGDRLEACKPCKYFDECRHQPINNPRRTGVNAPSRPDKSNQVSKIVRQRTDPSVSMLEEVRKIGTFRNLNSYLDRSAQNRIDRPGSGKIKTQQLALDKPGPLESLAKRQVDEKAPQQIRRRQPPLVQLSSPDGSIREHRERQSVNSVLSSEVDSGDPRLSNTKVCQRNIVRPETHAGMCAVPLSPKPRRNHSDLVGILEKQRQYSRSNDSSASDKTFGSLPSVEASYDRYDTRDEKSKITNLKLITVSAN